MFFFSSRRRHTRYWRDWSSDVCSSDLAWGYTPEEFMGAVRLELVHPDDIKRVRAEFAEIWSRPGIGPPVEYRIRHKDGHWIHLEASANNLRDDPEVQGMLIKIGRASCRERV